VYATQIWLFTIPFMTLNSIAMEAFANFETGPRPYDLSKTHIFVADSHHKLIELGEYSDVYQALEMLAACVALFDKCVPGRLLGQATALGVVTCGWSAPIDECVNVAPSKHPRRQRMRLVVAVNTNLEMAGVAGIEDNPDTVMIDGCQIHSPLMEALKATMEAILAYQKKLGLRK
jgi:hypothetical protein